jgi:hypothetical protein
MPPHKALNCLKNRGEALLLHLRIIHHHDQQRDGSAYGFGSEAGDSGLRQGSGGMGEMVLIYQNWRNSLPMHAWSGPPQIERIRIASCFSGSARIANHARACAQ